MSVVTQTICKGLESCQCCNRKQRCQDGEEVCPLLVFIIYYLLSACAPLIRPMISAPCMQPYAIANCQSPTLPSACPSLGYNARHSVSLSLSFPRKLYELLKIICYGECSPKLFFFFFNWLEYLLLINLLKDVSHFVK